MSESKGTIAEVAVTPTRVDRSGDYRRSTTSMRRSQLGFFLQCSLRVYSFALSSLSFLLVSTHTLSGNVTPRAVMFIVSFAIVLIIYHTLSEGIKGVTLGKWLLQIAVVREDFTAIGLCGSVIRNGIRLVDALPFVVPYVLGTIIARSNTKRQRVGDQVARSIVINV